MSEYIPAITRRLVILLITLFLTGWVRAQSVRLPQPGVITDRQGLPQAFVPYIIQDKQGFIWAATRDGLCRYDGYRFKVFQPDPDGRPSLSFAGLNQIELDRQGRIWIVSERGDIDVFDPRTETFGNLSRQAEFRRLIKPGTTYRLRMDRQDRLWLMIIGDGVVCWDRKKKRGQWFRHDPRQTASLGSNRVDDVVEDTDGTIWLATDTGLDRFEETTRSFRHLRHEPGNPLSLPQDAFTASYLRPNGEIILLSRYYLTLGQFNGKTYTAYTQELDPNHQFTTEEMVQLLIKHNLYYWAPGTDFHYSNTGYSMLGYIIARVYSLKSGNPKTYDDYLQDHIVGPGTKVPLALRFPVRADDTVLPAPRAEGVERTPDGKTIIFGDYNMSAQVAEGNGYGTPASLNMFVRTLMKGQNVLTPETVKLMHTNINTGKSNGNQYALGSFYTPNLGFGHNGERTGTLSLMMYDPATDVSVVAFITLVDNSKVTKDATSTFFKSFNAIYGAAYGGRAAIGYPGRP